MKKKLVCYFTTVMVSVAFAGDLYVSMNQIHAVEGSDLGWGTYVTDDGLEHDAYTNLQQAVSAALNGDTVWVENGFVCDDSQGCLVNPNGNSNMRLSIKKGVTVRSRSGHWTSGCVIEGSNAEPKVGGVFFEQNDHSGRLIGFEIRYCEITGLAGKAVYYGSISNCFVHSSLGNGLTLENVWAYGSVVSNCWASQSGIGYNGAYYNCEFVDIGKDKVSERADDAMLKLQAVASYTLSIVSNCTFRNCYGNPWLVASHQVYSRETAPRLIDCRFEGCRGAALVGNNNSKSSDGAPASRHLILENCEFTGNTLTGACIAESAGTLPKLIYAYNCIFTNNNCAAVNSLGEFYNCLMADNSAGGAIIANPYADVPLTLYNCTVFGNTGTGTSSTIGEGVAAVNTIVRGNTVQEGSSDTFVAATNSCLESSAVVQAGANNIFTDPLLAAPSDGFYMPLESSPCRDSGSVAAYVLSQTDLAGRPRTTEGKVAIGAYEYDAGLNYLSGKAVFPNYFYAPANITFNATSFGFGTDSRFYWDIDGDGATDLVTATPSLSHSFGSGDWTVTVCVSNLTAGTGSAFTYDRFSIAERPVRYVKVGNEDAAEPYDTQATAAADIQTAIDFSDNGDEIVILPGVYSNSSPVTVNKDLTVRGATGNPEDVVIHQTAAERCLHIYAPKEAIVHSLVLENGNKNGKDCQGAGALIASDDIGVSPACGTLSNVVVRNCFVTFQLARCPGVAAIGPKAFVTHSVISNCNSFSGFQNQGRLCALALYLKDGSRAENCLIARNYTKAGVTYQIPYDADIWNWEKGKIGYAYQGLYHVTVHVGDKSSMRFCTIVTNTASFCGGINVLGSGRFSNCVIADNLVRIKYIRDMLPRYRVWSAFEEPTDNWHFEKENTGKQAFDGYLAREKERAASAEYYAAQTTNACDVAENGLGEGTIAAASKKLVRDAARGRYYLPTGSPAIDVVPRNSVFAMAAGDLLGNDRLIGGAYDLGAYEKVQRGSVIIIR